LVELAEQLVDREVIGISIGGVVGICGRVGRVRRGPGVGRLANDFPGNVGEDGFFDGLEAGEGSRDGRTVGDGPEDDVDHAVV
jgi:hypothetical protein